MKWGLAVIISVCCATQSYADDTCENAVDTADSMNVNQNDCDYSDKGLNGFLQKAFKKGSEGAVLETTADRPVDVHKSDAKERTADKFLEIKKTHSLNVEVDQWANVALARTQLLPKAMEQCGKGFSVERELYRPLAMGRIALSVEFICLE